MLVRRAVAPFFCALVTLLLAGCGAGPVRTGSIGSSAASGTVFGGQQPVVGAAIQMYAVGTGGDGSAATPMLTSTVTSGAGGQFTITGLYSCTGASQVYIVATGGNPGLSGANPQIALMAALGPCSSLTPSTFISINELTTVAAVSALAPFMSSATNVGSGTNDAAALASAFALANEFVSTTAGAAPGTGIPAGYTDPVAELNTLADVVAACVNSTGGVAGDGSLCGQLFTLTTVSPNAAPTNTIAALLNVAGHPTQNAAALYGLTPPTPPFQPTLTGAPASWQIALIPPSTGLSLQVSPGSIAFADTSVGASSAAQTVTVANTGTYTVTLAGVAISGANGAEFSIAGDTCGASLAAGASCAVEVVAKPAAAGSRTASLVVTSDAPGSPATVGLAVNGTPVYGPMSLTSGVSFTVLGALQDLTLTNQGSTAVKIASVTETDGGGSSPYFTVAANTCGTTVAAGASCVISVASSNSPQGVEPVTVTGTLKVVDDAGTQTAALSSADAYAVEVNAGLVMAPSTGIVSFPATRVGSFDTEGKIYYMAWAHNAVAPPLALTLGGAAPADFTGATYSWGAPMPSSTCPYDYAYSEQCQITYTFKPTAAGERTAKLSLDPAYGPATGQYVLLEGTGVAGNTGFRASPGSLTLESFLPGNLDAKSNGAAIVTVTNIGITQLSLTAAASGTVGPYVTASTANCATLNPSATCTVAVTFSAPAAGTYTGNLTLTDATSGFAVAVPVTATTANWAAVATPNVLNFGTVAEGSTSAAQSFVIADPNGYPLGHGYTVSLAAGSNFELTQGATCAASTTQTCTLGVAFAPKVAGAISETATITDETTGVQTGLALYGTGGAATYGLSTSGVVFAPSVVGGTAGPVAVTLTANGGQPVTVSGVSITGTDAGSFTETNNCATLAAGGTCTISVTFKPAAAGTGTASLQIASNAVGSVTSVPLSGTASAATGSPVLEISPGTVTFPAPAIGTASAAQAVTITNAASGPVSVSTVAATGATGAAFAVLPGTSCVGTLSAGGSCTVLVTATPTGASGSGSLVVTSTAPESPQTVGLAATGTPTGVTSGGSTATLTPSSFTFTIWGANKDFAVNNTGSNGLTVTGVAAAATGGNGQQHGYTTVNDTCTTVVAPGGACTFTVSPYLLEPLSSYAGAPGTTTGQVYVTNDGAPSPLTASILDSETAYLLQGTGGVNGSGIGGTVSFAASPVGSSETMTVQLAKLTSGSPAATLAVSGANAGDFTVSAVEPSVSATAGSSCPGMGTAACTITITFKPTAIGTRTAKISLDSASTTTGQYIFVTGTALPAAAGAFFTTSSASGVVLAASVPPGSSTTATGTQTVTVTNLGSTTLNLAAAITGANATAFTADTSQCGAVAPQGTCGVGVTFAGGIAGSSSTASLLLYDQGTSASATVALTGTVSAGSPSVSFGADVPIYPYVTFAAQPVNTIGPPMAFTVNGFGDPVTLSLSSTSFTLTGPASCAAGAQACSSAVAFSPGTTGSVTATLTATDTVTGKQTAISLNGSGQ